MVKELFLGFSAAVLLGANLFAMDQSASQSQDWWKAGQIKQIAESLGRREGDAWGTRFTAVKKLIDLRVSNEDISSILRQKGIDINEVLIMAIINEHSALVPTLLAAGADPNVRREHGKTPLQWAADHRHLTHKGERWFFTIVSLGQMEVDWHEPCDDMEKSIKSLLAAGAAVNAQDEYGNTALHYAAFRKCRKCYKALSRAPGVDLSLVDAEGKTAPQSW